MSLPSASGPSTPSDLSIDANDAPPPTQRAALWLGCLIVGYIGVYLCRKNFSVAIPLLQEQWGVSREQLGQVASVSTLTYAIGKICFGPIIDRFGGRVCFFASLLAVAVFGGFGALAPSLPLLTCVYSANRFAGSACWGSMVKLVPDWFAPKRLALAMAFLSLSFVFGGACATLFAGFVAHLSHNDWRAVMGFPAVVLVVLTLGCWFLLPRAGKTDADASAKIQRPPLFSPQRLAAIAQVPQFWVVCALSFALTLMRETFNTWTVDFFKSEGGSDVSHHIAAFLSTPFDVCGAIGIIGLGWMLDRVGPAQRRWILFGILAGLTGLLLLLPHAVRAGLGAATVAVGLIGLLVYGPYSLLAGVMAVEIRGKEYAGTVAGLVDFTGYLAGYLAGAYFGGIVDRGGYAVGFSVLATLTGASAFLCLLLYRNFGMRGRATNTTA